MAQQFSWKLDLERCVGCNACTVACKSENNSNPTLSDKADGPSWRWVVRKKGGVFATMNSSYAETFVSMSCNHCKNPACLKACPVKPNAITKDSDTGIVTIDNTKCIGCKRCMWACPYGAPRYNKTTKKVEKCTACSHKLMYKKADGTYVSSKPSGDTTGSFVYTTPPACVATCTGRALNHEVLKDTTLTGSVGSVPEGFANPKLTNPQINFVK